MRWFAWKNEYINSSDFCPQNWTVMEPSSPTDVVEAMNHWGFDSEPSSPGLSPFGLAFESETYAGWGVLSALSDFEHGGHGNHGVGRSDSAASLESQVDEPVLLSDPAVDLSRWACQAEDINFWELSYPLMSMEQPVRTLQLCRSAVSNRSVSLPNYYLWVETVHDMLEMTKKASEIHFSELIAGNNGFFELTRLECAVLLLERTGVTLTSGAWFDVLDTILGKVLLERTGVTLTSDAWFDVLDTILGKVVPNASQQPVSITTVVASSMGNNPFSLLEQEEEVEEDVAAEEETSTEEQQSKKKRKKKRAGLKHKKRNSGSLLVSDTINDDQQVMTGMSNDYSMPLLTALCCGSVLVAVLACRRLCR